jgi:GT2 family glycosyltransferase
MTRPFLTVVICSIDAAKYEHCTGRYRELLGGGDYELIGIHDAPSLAAAYNWAARRARGELVLFSHDDVEVLSPDPAAALGRAMVALDVIGVAGTSRVVDAYWPRAGHPHVHGWVTKPGPSSYTVNVFGVDATITAGLEALDGMFFAATPEVLRRVPFDATTFDGFHGYDVDFTFRAHRAGFRVGTTAEIALIHESGGAFGADWSRYAARFAAKHRDRLEACAGIPSWSIGAVKVATKDDVLRAFPLARLQEITARLRATPDRMHTTG